MQDSKHRKQCCHHESTLCGCTRSAFVTQAPLVLPLVPLTAAPAFAAAKWCRLACSVSQGACFCSCSGTSAYENGPRQKKPPLQLAAAAYQSTLQPAAGMMLLPAPPNCALRLSWCSAA